MEKIKSVISGHRKSTDTPNEPVSPSSRRPEKSASSDMPHPIYDEFASKHHPGDSVNHAGNATKFPDASNADKTQHSQAIGTSLLRPDATQGHQSAQSEAVSTVSVKSGVIGHPPTSNAANTHGVQHGVRDDAKSGLRNEEPNSFDTRMSDGTNESTTGTGGDRAFPLAGGVTLVRPFKGATTTSERDPGTKDQSLGVHDGEGKEALAGAAAAATTSLDRNHIHDTKDAGTERYHPDALATATAAAANTRSPATQNLQTNTQGERHIAFCGSPEASVDPSRRPSPLTHASEPREPRLHIPGEYPSPTPVTQPAGPSYFQSKDVSTANPTGQHDLRHTGALENPQTRPGDQEKLEHHDGKDAAIAGGLGAAGVAAYAASKHGHDESAQTDAETFPTEPSPYSSKKVDPRVDNVPISSYDQQRFDPTTSPKHQERDAVLTGGGPLHRPSDKPQSQAHDDRADHHHGRDAALLGAGAGAATTAGLYANQRVNEPDTGPASSTIGPHKSNIANVLDPRVQPDPALQKHHHAAQTVDDPAPHTVGPHKSDTANIFDPRVLPDPQKQKAHLKEKHRAGDATSAGTGIHDAVESYDTHRATQPAASMNDQRYDPLAPSAHNPAARAPHQFHESEKERNHHGRDAALVGGLGAAGAGVYAATRDDDATTQRIQDQSQPPSHGFQQLHVTQPHYGKDHTVDRGMGVAGTGVPVERHGDKNVTSLNPSSIQSTQQPYPGQPQYVPGEATQKPQHHYGRDAAVMGGLGAAGAGAYAATRGGDHPQPTGSLENQHKQPGPQPTNGLPSQQHHYGRDAAVVGGLGAAGAGVYTATHGGDHTQSTGPLEQQRIQPESQFAQAPSNHQQHQRYDSVQGPNTQDHHQKRDAAAAGTAGALAGAGGAYAYSQHDAEKERKAAEKAHEHQLKEQQQEFEREQKKAQKAQEKALHDKQKELERQHAKELKHHNKLVAAEEKKHHKEMEKEQRENQHHHQQQHEEAQHEEDGEKKKHHVFGFLHRDKDKRSSIDESSGRRSVENPRQSREYTGPGHRASGSLHSSDGEHKGRNKLHKEPPPGHPVREAMEHQQHQDHERSPVSGKRHFFSRKRMSGSDHNGDRPISSGIYSTDDAAWHHESYAEPHMQPANNAEAYGPGTGRTEGAPM